MTTTHPPTPLTKDERIARLLAAGIDATSPNTRTAELGLDLGRWEATVRELEAAVARRSPEGAERAALEKIAELADGAEGDGDPEWTLGEIGKIAEAALASPTREPTPASPIGAPDHG